MKTTINLIVTSAAAIASIAMINGCASITKGTTQVVSINSNVKGANVTVNGIQVGTTPFNGPIARQATTTVTVAKEGFDTKNVTLTTEIESIFWGNVIIGGVIGSTTDAATGAMYYYAPATIQIDLEKAASAANEEATPTPEPKKATESKKATGKNAK